MRENARYGRGLDEPGPDVVLPADSFTIGTSLARKPILVAHTGQAHLGLVLGRRFRRQLARARKAASPRMRPRSPVPDDETFEPRRHDPPVIAFRHATAHELRVRDGVIHLTLHAAGEHGKPDVHVELRLDPLTHRM